MADFFSRLAQRVLGQAELAQPRIVPAFAPVGEQAETEPETPLPTRQSETAGQASQPGPESEFPGAENEPSEPVLYRPAPVARMAPPQLAPRSESRPFVPFRGDGLSAQQAPPARPGRLEAAPPPPDPIPPLAAPGPSATPPPAEAQGLSEEGRHKTFLEGQELEREPQSAPLGFQFPEPLVPLPDSPVSRDQEAGPATTEYEEQVVPVRPVSRQLPSLGTSQPEIFSPAPESPTIKVTIGRVEVRAARPPAASRLAPPASPRKPSLSLDDYLKKRAGDQQ